ncbi:creatininase family protein [Jiangella anatolica]|uniref:Creatininase n=1 Tax=Jiangella anatolica TaxID=2670374 RepID=A0A2W2BWB1_9ACTN|nr:creatininase family protein [Jiangella anatolica]PZF84228.1 creatininase [Jiangella anatolica]
MTALLAELTRAAVASRAPQAVAVVPVGACEQHGPHLPLGTDLMVAEHLALAAASRLAGSLDVIVAPGVAVGYSPHHVPIGATLTAGAATLLAQLRDVCAGLAAAGFGRVFLLNGHGGNAELVVVAAREAGQALRVTVGAGSYWVMAWDELVAAGAQDRGRLPGHAGAFETSLALALRPDLVDAPPHRPGSSFVRNPAGYWGRYHVERPDAMAQGDGFSDDPSAGSAADGRRYLEAATGAVAGALREFAGQV